MNTIIHIDLDALDARLKGGELWEKGWGDPADPNAATCLHGAVRYCAPQPGDAYIIEQVGARFGFGIGDNDDSDSWATIRAKVVPDITDEMLAATFGPQWESIVALVRRCATLTADEARALAAARAATRAAAGDAARAAARAAAGAAARAAAGAAARAAAGDAARAAAGAAAWAAAWDAAWDAAGALVTRDLIGDRFTQAQYDLLTKPWRDVIGPVHPEDAP